MPDRPRNRGPAYPFVPMTMTWGEVAGAVFRCSESWLRDHLPDDFPRADPLYDVFATEAVEAWVRRRFGLVSAATSPDDAEDILIRRAHGQDRSAASRRTPA